YGIKANTDWKASLGTEWRQYEETFPLLRESSIDTVSLESRGSHVPVELVELLRGKKVMLGAIDVADPRVETPEAVADTLRRALAFVEPENLCPSTNCGMAPLARSVAQGKMRALAAGAALLRSELSEG
ncbi:MAG TPA: methionine synthase, partial [Candidatus Brachybacterium merdigallinarum]|nr:methionine synthase [Candidatus Brachybacterium merdigallinarum]